MISLHYLSEDDNATEDIASMPGISRFGVNALRKHLEPLIQKGLSSILVFGVIEQLPKVILQPAVSPFSSW